MQRIMGMACLLVFGVGIVQIGIGLIRNGKRLHDLKHSRPDFLSEVIEAFENQGRDELSVRLRGRLSGAAETQAPLSGTECLYWRLVCRGKYQRTEQTRDTDGRLRTVVQENVTDLGSLESTAALTFSDESLPDGVPLLLADFEDAAVELQETANETTAFLPDFLCGGPIEQNALANKQRLGSLEGYRLTEQVIYPEDEVEVTGVLCRAEDGTLVLRRNSSGGKSLLTNLPEEELAKRFRHDRFVRVLGGAIAALIGGVAFWLLLPDALRSRLTGPLS